MKKILCFLIFISVLFAMDNVKKCYEAESQTCKIQDGILAFYDDNEILKSFRYFENGKITRFISYYDNGGVEYDMPFKNEKREGITKWYHPNGILQDIVPFSNNKVHGVWKSYDTNGNLITLKFMESNQEQLVIYCDTYQASGYGTISVEEMKLTCEMMR